MFDKEGYFCCLEGQTGFYNKSNPGLVGVGCSDGPPSGEGVVTLNLKTQGSYRRHILALPVVSH